MSFILDALKKSESERKRQTGPVLMDVRIAAPRRRWPGWVWVLGAALLANLALVGYLLSTSTPREGERAAAVPAAPPATAPAVAATAISAASVVAPATPVAAPATPIATLPPAAAPAQSAGLSQLAAPESTLASEPDPNDVNLPTLQDLQASGITLPPLVLNLHVYDSNAANRYVLLNSLRLREGDFTPEGVRLEHITAQGVILESRGRRFRLDAGG
jgi:general secretion pathway protein B